MSERKSADQENEIINPHLMAIQDELEKAGIACEAVVTVVFLKKVPADWRPGTYLPGTDYNVAYACGPGEGGRYGAAAIEILAEIVSRGRLS